MLLAAVAGCNQSASSTTTDENPDKSMVIGGEAEPVAFNTASLPTVSFEVPHMHCEIMCVPKVRKTLAAQPGVKDVRVDLETKTATVAVEGDSFDAVAAVLALETAEFADSKVKAEPSAG
jgi:copper chaperone CopZ